MEEAVYHSFLLILPSVYFRLHLKASEVCKKIPVSSARHLGFQYFLDELRYEFLECLILCWTINTPFDYLDMIEV